jgi:transposase
MIQSTSLIISAGILAEIDDLMRFESPRQLITYLGLVPYELSVGDVVRRGSLTKIWCTEAR